MADADPIELVRAGRPDEALAALQAQVRQRPEDPKLRVFLFQLLAVLGQWDRAMTQLNVAAGLDPQADLMAQVCRTAINCEALRREVFAGTRAPLVFGEPEPWVGWLLQAVSASAAGRAEEARELRARAMDAAPASAGSVNGVPFAWVADADQRLGPVLEAVINGRYFWVPFDRLALLETEAPTDLRDLVWLPATFTWANGGSAVGLVPTRYVGSDECPDGAIRLSRRTEWSEGPDGAAAGLGQRMFCTDADDYPLLEVRRLEVAPA